MHASALPAVVGLAAPFRCNSRSAFTSFNRSSCPLKCGIEKCRASLGRRKLSVVAASRPSESNPSRAVFTDEIEGIPVGEYGERMLVPNHLEEDEYEDDFGEIKLECDSSGCTIIVPEGRKLSDQASGSGYLRCDLSGCYLTPEAPAVKGFDVVEGQGWRLGYETAPDSMESFCAVVGAGQWSLALTGAEFSDFCSLIQALRKGILAVEEENFPNRDNIVLQVERGSVWMESTVPKNRVHILQQLWKPGGGSVVSSRHKQAFEIRFILSGGGNKRQAEGFWPAEAVMDMLKKLMHPYFPEDPTLSKTLKDSVADDHENCLWLYSSYEGYVALLDFQGCQRGCRLRGAEQAPFS